MTSGDHFNLQRFVDSQEAAFSAALAEIEAGHKSGHWMWFIFPQIKGLGQSAMARFYAIGSLEEVRAYLAHPTLGPRLTLCVRMLQSCAHSDPVEVFGSVDALKLRSSLTLFAAASGGALYDEALWRWFDGPDPVTLALLKAGS